MNMFASGSYSNSFQPTISPGEDTSTFEMSTSLKGDENQIKLSFEALSFLNTNSRIMVMIEGQSNYSPNIRNISHSIQAESSLQSGRSISVRPLSDIKKKSRVYISFTIDNPTEDIGERFIKIEVRSLPERVSYIRFPVKKLAALSCLEFCAGCGSRFDRCTSCVAGYELHEEECRKKETFSHPILLYFSLCLVCVFSIAWCVKFRYNALYSIHHCLLLVAMVLSLLRGGDIMSVSMLVILSAQCLVNCCSFAVLCRRPSTCWISYFSLLSHVSGVRLSYVFRTKAGDGKMMQDSDYRSLVHRVEMLVLLFVNISCIVTTSVSCAFGISMGKIELLCVCGIDVALYGCASVEANWCGGDKVGNGSGKGQVRKIEKRESVVGDDSMFVFEDVRGEEGAMDKGEVRLQLLPDAKKKKGKEEKIDGGEEKGGGRDGRRAGLDDPTSERLVGDEKVGVWNGVYEKTGDGGVVWRSKRIGGEEARPGECKMRWVGGLDGCAEVEAEFEEENGEEGTIERVHGRGRVGWKGGKKWIGWGKNMKRKVKELREEEVLEKEKGREGVIYEEEGEIRVEREDEVEVDKRGVVRKVNGQKVEDVASGVVRDREGRAIRMEKQKKEDVERGVYREEGGMKIILSGKKEEVVKGVFRDAGGARVSLSQQTYGLIGKGIILGEAGETREVYGQRACDIKEGKMRLEDGTVLEVTKQKEEAVKRGELVTANGVILYTGCRQELGLIKVGIVLNERGERMRLRDQTREDLGKGRFKGCRYDEEMVPKAPKKKSKMNKEQKDESFDMFVDDSEENFGMLGNRRLEVRRGEDVRIRHTFHTSSMMHTDTFDI